MLIFADPSPKAISAGCMVAIHRLLAHLYRGARRTRHASPGLFHFQCDF